MRQEFIGYLREVRKYSDHTLLAYENDLHQFSQYLESTYQSDDYTTVEQEHIRSWLVYLLDQDSNPKTIHRKLSALKSFYKYLINKGQITKNPASGVLVPKIPKRLPVVISEDKMDQLITGTGFVPGFEGQRDKLIIEMFYYTGIRLSELINLQDQDIFNSDLVLKVKGKRNKERLIPFERSFEQTIQLYIRERNKMFPERSNDFFFITVKGEKMYPKLVYNLVNQHLELVSTAKKRSPHVLRHSFATAMLENGCDLASIKELLGHSSLSATQVYTHNTIARIKKIYNQSHPKA